MIKILIIFLASNVFAQSEIIGGVEVKMPDPVALSTVQIKGQIDRATFTCSGVLIRQDIVLTAGHCLGPGWAKLEVYFADDSGPAYVHSQDWSSQYSPDAAIGSPKHDVAILHLLKPAPIKFQPVEISDEELVIGQTLLFAGYGQSTPLPTSREGVGTLRKVEQNVLAPHLNPFEFVADIHNRGPCFGDSGGPAYVVTNKGLKLVGVASRLGPTNAEAGNPKVYECKTDIIYTNVSSEMSWISTQL